MNSDAKKISFNKEDGEFLSTLRERVHLYFKSGELSPKANVFMYAKSIFLASLVALSYGAILADFSNGWGVVGLYILFGSIFSICTMNIAHDALHGAYLSHPKWNRVLGFMMDVFGASSFYWRKEHVVDHHTFTNIADHDADLDVPILLRLCSKAPLKPYHRFQQWYAPILYSLNIIRWVYYSDFKRIYLVFKNGKTGPHSPSKVEVFMLLFFKVVHVCVFLVIPILILSVAWWQIALGYLACLAVSGLILTTIFQLAHIIEDVSFPEPNGDGKMENSFVKHQLATTSNFAMESKLVNFLFGGLNFQVEHHIFPHICHMHLSKISPIIQSTAKEFNVPYHHNASFFAAIKSHYKTLHKLGRNP